MGKRGLLISVAGIALAMAGGVSLVVAQETAPAEQAPAAASAPAKPVGLSRDYSIGTLAPEDTTAAQAPADGTAALTNTTAAPEPLKRPRYGAAILQAVDKVTAETLRFEAQVGHPVRFKGLVVTVNTCETTAMDEDAPDSIAHLSVLSQPEGVTTATARDAYRGWMFANAPAVHPFQHPVYDVWLIACKTAAPLAPAAMP